MTSAAHYDRDQVLAELTPAAALSYFSVKATGAGDQWRTKHCPTCGPRSRDSVVIDARTGRWIDHAHGCAGDLLGLVAGLAGLDARRDFARVLEVAAEIAGVTPTGHATTAAERAKRHAVLAEQARRHAEAEVEAAHERRQAAIGRAAPMWTRMSSTATSTATTTYLAQRGLPDFHDRRVLRFTEAGDLALALRTADGLIVNIVTRYLPEHVATTKVRGLADCPTLGTFGDALSDISGPRTVVLVEGAFDTLSAKSLWPRAVILGAHGASNIPKIAVHAARRVVLAGGRLVFVPHADDAGRKAVAAAVKAAVELGLAHSKALFTLEPAAKDLNDGLVAHGAAELRGLLAPGEGER